MFSCFSYFRTSKVFTYFLEYFYTPIYVSVKLIRDEFLILFKKFLALSTKYFGMDFHILVLL